MSSAAPTLHVRAARSSLWTLSSQGVQMSIGALAFALLSKWVGPADYGLVAMASTATGLVGVIGDGGMVAAVIREPEVNSEVEATASWIAFATGAALCLATAASAPLIGAFYRNSRVIPLAIVLSLTFAINAVSYVPRAKLSKQLDFRHLAIATVASSFISLCGAWLVARRGGGAWSLVTNLLLGLVVQSVLVNFWARPTLALRHFSPARGRALATFSKQLSTFGVAIIIGRTADSILVGRYLGDGALGTMTTATLLVAMPVGRVCGSVSGVFLPTLMKLPAEAQGRAFASLSEVMTAVLCPMCLGLLAIAPELCAAMPERWHGVGPALRIVCVGMLLEPVGYLAVAVLSSQARVRELSRLGILMIPFSWVGAIAGVALGSVQYVLAAWALVNLGGGVALLWLVGPSLRLGPWYLKMVATPFVGSAAMACIVRALMLATPRVPLLPRLSLGITCGIAVYVLFAALFLREPAGKMLSLIVRSSRTA